MTLGGPVMVDKANRYGISTEELLEIFQMVTED